MFVELVEIKIHCHSYNIQDLGYKQSSAIHLKIVVGTDGQTDGIDYEIMNVINLSQRPLMIYDTPTKAEN